MFAVRRYKQKLDRLIGQWTEYRSLVLNRMGAPDLKPEEEKAFLALKGKVAEDLTALSLWLSHSLAQEVQTHLRAIHSLLSRYPTLFSNRPLDESMRAEFERDWHDHFLFFNRLKGIQPQPKAQLPRETMGRITGAVPDVPPMRKPSGGARIATVSLRLLFLVGIAALIIRFVPWEQLKASGARGLLIATGDRVKEVFSGTRPISLGGVLDPVVEAYGSEVTLIMVAALLLLAGYFIFVRMK